MICFAVSAIRKARKTSSTLRQEKSQGKRLSMARNGRNASKMRSQANISGLTMIEIPTRQVQEYISHLLVMQCVWLGLRQISPIAVLTMPDGRIWISFSVRGCSSQRTIRRKTSAISCKVTIQRISSLMVGILNASVSALLS